MVGLSFPTAIETRRLMDHCLSARGAAPWPLLLVGPTRIIPMAASGEVDVIADEIRHGGPRGLAWH